MRADETVAALEGTNRPYVAYEFTLTASGAAYTDRALVYIPAENLPANRENPKGFVVDGDQLEEITGYYTADEKYFVFEMPHFSTGGVVGKKVNPLMSYTKTEAITLVEGKSETITLPGDVEDQVLTDGLLDSSVATVEVKVDTVSSEDQYDEKLVSNPQHNTPYVIKRNNQYLTADAGWTGSLAEAAEWTWDNSGCLKCGNLYLRYSSLGGLRTVKSSNQAQSGKCPMGLLPAPIRN